MKSPAPLDIDDDVVRPDLADSADLFATFADEDLITHGDVEQCSPHHSSRFKSGERSVAFVVERARVIVGAFGLGAAALHGDDDLVELARLERLLDHRCP